MIAFLLLTSTAFGLSTVQLPKDLLLSWDFVQDNLIEFSFSIPEEVLAKSDYAGVGFKTTDEGRTMADADIVFIYLDSDQVLDSWAFTNDVPAVDTAIGGTEDCMASSCWAQGTSKVCSWQRTLNTGDEYDKLFTEGESYTLLWAVGDLDEAGVPMHHHRKDKGMETIQLIRDFQPGVFIDLST